MRAPGWILGFHGCDLEVAERVLGGTDEVRTSANAYAGFEPIDTVHAPYMEGGPLYPGAKIASRTHVQWCVREPRRSIIRYFRPRDSGAENV